MYVSLGKSACLETKSLQFLTGGKKNVDSKIGFWIAFIYVF